MTSLISFKPFLPGRASTEFSDVTPPVHGLSQAENDRNFFTPQLRLRVKDTFPVVLQGLPFPFPGSIKTIKPILATPSNGLVNVQFKMFNLNERVYDITAKGAGESLVTAFEV